MVNSFNSQVKFSCPGPEPSLTISRPAFYIKIAPSKNSFPAQSLDLVVFLNFYIFIRLEFFLYVDSYSKNHSDSSPFFKSWISRLENKGNFMEPYLEMSFNLSRLVLVFSDLS